MANRPSDRLMRQAVAYARLAAKAQRAGNHSQTSTYYDRYITLRAQAARMQERETARKEGR